MKSKKIIFLERILRLMAIAVLRRQNPRVVAVTGSVGKSSTKDAIFAVLSSKYKIRGSKKNYNNEIGIPLVIIGAKSSGGKNIFKWFWIFLKWIYSLITPFYPKILLFEFGIDRPGDMDYFMSLTYVDVGIVTNIATNHIEFFGTVENIAKEKRILVESLEPSGFAILNADDELVSEMAGHTKAQVMTFGFSEKAVVNASNLIYNYEDGKPAGISFKLNYDGKNIPIRLRNIMAGHYAYEAMAAICVGILFKINLVDIAVALEPLKSPQGRLNLLEGKNRSYIIDDTYNASPMATISALDVLEHMKTLRRIAVLGDMLELGDETEKGHKEVAEKIFSSKKIDMVFAVGERMQYAVKHLIELGYPATKIFGFAYPEIAADKIAEIVREGDFVLVKGSQGMRMEKVVEKLLADPSQAPELLCRQDKYWKNIPFTK